MINAPVFAINVLRVSTESGLALNLEFDLGLNVIRGDNSSGRTTILKLIEFGLGNPRLKSRDFIPEVLKCKRVLVEVNLNGAVYTFERLIRKSGEIDVYKGRIDEYPRPYGTVFSPGQDISSFILAKLGIPRVTIVEEYSNTEKSVSFSDIFSTIYLDQDVGFSRIHGRLSRPQSTSVFKLLAGISSPDMYELNVNIESQKRRLKEMQSELDAVGRFLSDVELLLPNEIKLQLDKLKIEKASLEQELSTVREQVRARPGYTEPLRTEILSLENDLGDHERELFFARQTLTSYQDLENQLLGDLDKSERAQSSRLILSSFEFLQCPRCLQDISQSMQQRESHGDCSLCGRELSSEKSAIDNLEGYRSQIAAQLDELSELQSFYIGKIHSLETKMGDLTEIVATKRVQFDEALFEFVSPVIRNVEVLSGKIANLEKKIESLEWQESLRSHIQQMGDAIASIEAKLEESEEQRQRLREIEELASKKLDHFRNYLSEFLKACYPTSIESVRLQPKNFMPIINNYHYDSKSTTEKNIAIIGYFYAQLRFSLEHDCHFPRFLVIDTLRQDDLDRGTYEEILRKLKELEERYADSFQIIMVVRDKFDLLLDNERIHLVDGNHLLNV